jgi:hypothetical protein
MKRTILEIAIIILAAIVLLLVLLYPIFAKCLERLFTCREMGKVLSQNIFPPVMDIKWMA